MARNNLTRPQRRKRSSAERGNFQVGSARDADRGYKDMLLELASNPTVRYVAGGIAAALLIRLAKNWAGKYPEISRFIRDNVDSLEDKFGSLKDGFAKSDVQRH